MLDFQLGFGIAKDAQSPAPPLQFEPFLVQGGGSTEPFYVEGTPLEVEVEP